MRFQITKLKCTWNSVCLPVSWLSLFSSWIVSFKCVFNWTGLLPAALKFPVLYIQIISSTAGVNRVLEKRNPTHWEQIQNLRYILVLNSNRGWVTEVPSLPSMSTQPDTPDNDPPRGQLLLIFASFSKLQNNSLLSSFPHPLKVCVVTSWFYLHIEDGPFFRASLSF